MLYLQRMMFGLKRVYRQPRLCLPVIISLGFTMAATLVVLTLCYNILVRPLPHVQQVEQLSVQNVDIKFGNVSVSFIDKHRFVSLQQHFADYGDWGYLQSRADKDAQINGELVKVTQFYTSHQTPALLGIPLLSGNAPEQTDAEQLVWISESLWRQHFNGSNNAVGQTLQFENTDYIIAGILPDFYAAPDNHLIDAKQIWHVFDSTKLAAQSQSTNFGSKATIILRSSGKKPDDAAMQQWLKYEKEHAPAHLAPLFKTTTFDTSLQPYRHVLLGESQKLLWLLLTVTTGLFSIACLNIINVLLAHYQSRQHEFAIQTFAGCNRSKLYLLVALENLSLIIPALLLGLLAAQWLFRFLPTLAGSAIPMTQGIALSSFSLIVATLVALLLLGLFSWPVSTAKTSLSTQLGQSGKGSNNQQNPTLIKSLLVLQLTIASVLITGSAALAWHSYQTIYTNWGFSMKNSYQIQLIPQELKPMLGKEPEKEVEQKNIIRQQQTLQLQQALKQYWPDAIIPESGTQPISTTITLNRISVDESTQTHIDHSSVVIDERYFDLYNIKLLHGRNFTADEETQAVIIDANFAQLLKPTNLASAVGQLLYSGSSVFQIVGIVNNVKTVMGHSLPMAYKPMTTENTPEWPSLVAILPEGQELLESEVQQALGELATGFEIRVIPMYKAWLKLTEQSRIYFYLISIMSATTLLLALLGIAGVSQMRAQQRRYELAIRMATGASWQKLLWLLSRESGALVLGGLAIGSVLTLLIYKRVPLWFNMIPDLSIMLLLSLNLLLLLVAIATLILPSWQVIRHDPMKALRML